MIANDELKKELLEIASIIDKFPASLQPQVFDMLINPFHKTGSRSGTSESRSYKNRHRPKTSLDIEKGKKRTGLKETVGILKDLNLRGTADVESFSSFQQQKAPRSNIEFTAVAVYYLAKELGLSGITPAHINTCYKDADRKPPLNFKQNLWDTSSHRYGYIDASDITNITIPHRGESFVEHNLPSKEKKTK